MFSGTEIQNEKRNEKEHKVDVKHLFMEEEGTKNAPGGTAPRSIFCGRGFELGCEFVRQCRRVVIVGGRPDARREATGIKSCGTKGTG